MNFISDMRILILYAIILWSLNGFANDSLIVKSSSNKWQLEFTCSYNYNYRKVVGISDNASYGLDIINNYLDTGNIACYTKNVGILITRKIWKYFGFEAGIHYGRKGYMYSRTQTSDYSGNNSNNFIKYIPEKMFGITFNLNSTFSVYKDLVKIGTNMGCIINSIHVFRENDKNYFFDKSYLADEKKGFFGFKPTTSMPSKTRLLHDISTSPTVPNWQYNIGTFVQVNLYKSIFAKFKYHYISQTNYSKSKEYENGSTLFRPVIPGVPYMVDGFTYEVKPYIHSFIIGLGFDF